VRDLEDAGAIGSRRAFREWHGLPVGPNYKRPAVQITTEYRRVEGWRAGQVPPQVSFVRRSSLVASFPGSKYKS